MERPWEPTRKKGEEIKYFKYLNGEHRVDGWKSQWRIDFERRTTEEARSNHE